MLSQYHSDPSKIAAALAVSLIASDGVIEEDEKAVAIAVGQRMLPGFSKATFEKLLEEVDHMASAYDLAAPLRKVLDDETKDMIIEFLVAVATADNEVVQVEAQELQAVADALGVPLPAFEVSRPSLHVARPDDLA